MLTLTHSVQLVRKEDHAETLHDHHTPTSIGRRPICNLRFEYDIDLMGGSSGELQDLNNRLVDGAIRAGQVRNFLTASAPDLSPPPLSFHPVWLKDKSMFIRPSLLYFAHSETII